MSSLKEFAKGSRSGPTPWREKNAENRAAWIEACNGIQKDDVSYRRAAIWLIQERGCPLMIDTVRNQLKATLHIYVK